MSLLQDVLKSSTLSASHTKELERRLKGISMRTNDDDAELDDDEVLVNVVSIPGTPIRTRPSSPTKSKPSSRSSSRLPGSSLAAVKRSSDPLRAFPTEISQRIFGRLGLKDLSTCGAVSQKWRASQTMNYVWFLYYRKDNFGDSSIPTGKWTKRESKQNWRQLTLSSMRQSALDQERSVYSGYSTPVSAHGDGTLTPREMKEEKWKAEASEKSSSKADMRNMYKELGGRKFKGKGKFGASSGVRDRGGWDDGDY
ncbi:hypothetical protein DL96DRAFT_1637613 [Flagelloscypha sp. PMI_526]|nr:hypothetical protein DL96DRAFT_1637613 [Flagelloscypha sp. PMI_526]